jgi:hypothetical protein
VEKPTEGGVLITVQIGAMQQSWEVFSKEFAEIDRFRILLMGSTMEDAKASMDKVSTPSLEMCQLQNVLDYWELKLLGLGAKTGTLAVTHQQLNPDRKKTGHNRKKNGSKLRVLTAVTYFELQAKEFCSLHLANKINECKECCFLTCKQCFPDGKKHPCFAVDAELIRASKLVSGQVDSRSSLFPNFTHQNSTVFFAFLKGLTNSNRLPGKGGCYGFPMRYEVLGNFVDIPITSSVYLAPSPSSWISLLLFVDSKTGQVTCHIGKQGAAEKSGEQGRKTYHQALSMTVQLNSEGKVVGGMLPEGSKSLSDIMGLHVVFSRPLKTATPKALLNYLINSQLAMTSRPPGDFLISAQPLRIIPSPSEVSWLIAASKKTCSLCLKPLEKVQRCSKCKTAYYCSRQCQEKNWSVHKKQCEQQQNTKVTETPDGVLMTRKNALD